MTSLVAVVIPSYNEPHANHVAEKCATLDCVGLVVLVDDCPECSNTGKTQEFSSSKIITIKNPKNLGVGGAFKRGLRVAINEGYDIVCKIDADDQMDLSYLPLMVNALRHQGFDLVKLNRLTDYMDWKSMPKTRVVANFILTLVMKLVSGYWNINDPANGQLVVDARKLDEFFFIEASDDFAFESSILIYFAKRDGKIAEFNVPAIYNESRSHVNLLAYYPKFFVLCTRWGCARISFQYIASNINLGSLYLLGTVVFGGFGSFWGGWHWISGAATGNPATAGSVGIALLSLLVSFASFFAFINLDAKRNPGTSLGRAVHDTRR